MDSDVRSAAASLNLVYIVESRVTERELTRYGINHFLELGYTVRIIELVTIFHPSLLNRYPPLEHRNVDSASPTNFHELKNVIAESSDASFIMCMAAFTGSVKTLKLYRMLSAIKRPYIVFSSNQPPGFSKHHRQSSAILAKYKFQLGRLIAGQINPLQSFLFRTPPQLLGIKPPAIIVYGGRMSFDGGRMFPLQSSTRAVQAHSYDYDGFLYSDSALNQSDNTAVYIDQNMGFQQALIALGEEMPLPPEQFYPKLLRLFERIESEFNLKVVIAANPRSNLDRHSALFGARKIIQGDTARMIKRCKMVLGHCSTAIGMAVMTRIPVLLIANREVYQHRTHKPIMEAFSQALNKPIEFFDDPASCSLSEALVVDQAAYDQYMVDYVKIPGSQNLPYWDIVKQSMDEFLYSPTRLGE